jgi:hypothetical protein
MAGLAFVSAVVPGAAGASGNLNEGAGKLRLGQTVQRVIQLTSDRPAQVFVRANGAVKALAFIGPNRGSTTVIRFSVKERTCQIIIQSPGLKTDLGHIGVGSTKQAVLTGLTFGTISSLYGLQAHIIDRTQFSLLVTVVVLSAIVPTAIAQRWFSPNVEAERAGDTPAHTRPVAPAPSAGVRAPHGATR